MIEISKTEGETIMSDQLNRMEEMLATLIQMQGAQNARMEHFSKELNGVKAELSEVKTDLNGVKAELSGVKETLHVFRYETNVRLTRIERHMRLVDVDLDRTIDDVELLKRTNG